MPLALLTGAARAGGIAAGIAPRLAADGWDVATSDLADADYPCDLSDPAGPQELIETVAAERGPISALVLSHAHDDESGILDTTAASFDRHVAVNARACLLLIAAFARQVPPGGGAVVALTSDHTTGNLPYGPIDTGWMDAATRDALDAHHPLGRLGTPADVAGVVAFLVSGEGRWVSGQLLHTDGGFSARF